MSARLANGRERGIVRGVRAMRMSRAKVVRGAGADAEVQRHRISGSNEALLHPHK